MPNPRQIADVDIVTAIGGHPSVGDVLTWNGNAIVWATPTGTVSTATYYTTGSGNRLTLGNGSYLVHG